MRTTKWLFVVACAALSSMAFGQAARNEMPPLNRFDIVDKNFDPCQNFYSLSARNGRQRIRFLPMSEVLRLVPRGWPFLRTKKYSRSNGINKLRAKYVKQRT
jgi:hypothetical protein